MCRGWRRGTTPCPDETLLERREVYSGGFIRLVLDEIRLLDGSASKREVVLHPGAAAVLPILPDGRILLVEQYRHAVGKRLWETPAGKLEVGETPLACAQRELREETGHDAETWEELCAFYTSPGFTNERMTLFLARDAFPVASTLDNKIASCRAFEQSELGSLARTGGIEDAKTILALGILFLRERSSRLGRA